MTDTIGRFSNRVADYVKYRPSYPDAMWSLFRDEMHAGDDSVIADVGSGTGISAKFFLDRGATVYGVEPNAAMRAAAEEFLKDFSRFTSLDGTAEATNLDDDSVDIAVAAQAFHWFDSAKTSNEFRRILKPGGFAALIWNERDLESTAFLKGYESILQRFGTDYAEVRHDHIETSKLREFFGGDFGEAHFENAQDLDFEGIKGRMKSSSYTPDESHPDHAAMIDELKSLFENCAENGKIEVSYNTKIFFRRL